MRVYIDTNIVGSYLRDFPEKLAQFKAAEHRGYRFYASTDGISELACNTDFKSFETQLSTLRTLVSENCIFKQPRDLVRSELLRLTSQAIVSPLLSPFEISEMLPFIVHKYTEKEFRVLQTQQHTDKRDFLAWDKDMSAKVDRLIGKDAMPGTFDEYWAFSKSSGELRATLDSICKTNGSNLDAETLDRLLETTSFKAIHVEALLTRLFPFTRLKKLKAPHKGDSIDIRHAVAGAYCDIFLSRDNGFREFFSIAGNVWPYKVMSPDDFLNLLSEESNPSLEPRTA